MSCVYSTNKMTQFWNMASINLTGTNKMLGLFPYALILCNMLMYATGTPPASATTVNYVVKTFTDESNVGDINHLVISEFTGKVYVGAVNKLYQLSENLTQEKSVITGPQDDAPNCRPNQPCDCEGDALKCEGFNKKSTKSVCKALVIDYDSDRLIVCSNIKQGHCEKRYLNDITQKENDIWIPMVPYDLESPAVLFIANGPSTSSNAGASAKKVLYIGATRSTVGEVSFKDLIFAISSRRLDNFRLTFDDIVQGSTGLNIEQSLRDIYSISYKYGFANSGFSYFLTLQKESSYPLESPLVTKILRICQNDTKFHSYAEMTLQCKNRQGVEFNKLQGAYVTRPGSILAQSLGLAHDIQTDLDNVLFGVFTKSNDDAAGSVMCMYPLRDIRMKFTEAIQECFRGVGNTGPDYMGSTNPCVKVSIPVNDDYCGDLGFNYPNVGNTPISAQSVADFPDARASGITVTTTYEFTVALVGTDNGALKKVVIESKDKAIDYETVVISEGYSVNSDLVMDNKKSHIYVVTNNMVNKIKVQDCSQYSTCYSCLGANDPYCGWCSLESRCTMQEDCPKASQPLQWLSYVGEQCTTILRIIPDQLQIRRDPDPATKLTLTVQNLPIPSAGTYQCAYTGPGMTPRTTTAIKIPNSGSNGATGNNSTLECETPPYNLLPVIPTGKDHIALNLAIRMDEKDFVSKNFTFFDCGRHSSCTSCTESAYPCTWCVGEHVCTHDREICGQDVLVTGKKVLGNSDRPGPMFCPRIEAGFTEILVPSTKARKVSVKALNLQSFQTNFQCEYTIDNIPQQPVNAALKDQDVIECELVKFEYRGQSRSLHVPFKITWAGNDGRRNALDNPENIQVKVYKCEEMADNCGQCLTLDNKYECGWCSSQSTCEINDECSKWLDHTAVCPNPSINRFYPTAGPREGGTVVTIEGTNLGKVFDDIKSGITVSGMPCMAIDDDSFVPAQRISCKTGQSTIHSSGNIEITVSNLYHTKSAQNFTYVQPAISSFTPHHGPVSGGTRVTIAGKHLNAGTNVSAYLVDKPCIIIRNEAEIIICKTPANNEVNGSIKLQIDNAMINYKGSNRFLYKSDPSISDVEPMASIVSGGITVTVTGSSFDIIKEPKMVIYIDKQQHTSNCEVQSSLKMTCPAPVLPKSANSMFSFPQILSFGFLLDNVSSVQNLTDQNNANFIPLFRYQVYPNPTFVGFKDGVKYFHTSNDILTIEGDNISRALQEEDIEVFIGKASCDVTAVSLKQLTCRPPSSKNEDVGGSPKVTVMIGKNLTYILGVLKYEEPQGQLRDSLPFYVGIGSAALLLIIIIIVVCVAYRRKSKENDRVMKQMQNQMDTLEAKVAKECKEAFAELQTDMTEITSEITSGHGIPFRDYRSFSMKVLFPNVPEEEHPVVRGLEVEYLKRGDLDKGLKNFSVLIGNKTFLLLFIRTLEQNQDFTMREKVNVASLISVALQNRMEYHTDILKTLLGELIEKSMDSKNHPKLLLRRTESVAEKMLTNWFTFLLYKFLTECAGEPLFLLYRALKQQIDKGPVDAVTSEARYSLSEDKLIRQQIDFKQITICVRDLDQGYSAPPQDHVVKILDCDSIAQVKDKILDTMYKNQPFSRRPDKDDLDLEWHTGVQGRLILKDEDVTTKSDGEYKRINTLAHYKVPDGAVLALVHKQTSMYNISSLTSSDRSGSQNHFYNTHPGTYGGSPSLSRSLSPNTITLDIENSGSKAYHLVKPSDSDTQKEGDRGNKMVSEIYLTRLLTTKGTLQKFVDDLFETIFSTASRDSALPLAIKYMFDFLDDQALIHGITDPEVVHTWKSNSLPLRFWVNVVKNPDFVFDIHKSNIVDSCLTVVGQTFMDSCSMSDHRLGKDSPSSKLLYAKEVLTYKRWVERYYQDIKQMPAISDQDMNAMLAEESRQHKYDFCINAALYELYQYAVRYNNELMTSLEEDEFAKGYRLAARLESVHQAMEITVPGYKV